MIRQSDGSQDELVRLYNELVCDNSPGITYTNFSSYLHQSMEQDEDDVVGVRGDDDRDRDTRNESFPMDAPLDQLRSRKSAKQKPPTGTCEKNYKLSC